MQNKENNENIETCMVLVSPDRNFLEFMTREQEEVMRRVLPMMMENGDNGELKIFEVDKDLKIKNILLLPENPLKIRRFGFDDYIGVSISSIEDENLPLLHQINKLVVQ